LINRHFSAKDGAITQTTFSTDNTKEKGQSCLIEALPWKGLVGLEIFQQHLAISRELGDRKGEGIGLFHAPLAYESLGDRAQALSLLCWYKPHRKRTTGRLFSVETTASPVGKGGKEVVGYVGRITLVNQLSHW
jgi:hypothetical protein